MRPAVRMLAMGGEDWPFLGRQAVLRGDVSVHQLRRDYQAVYRNVYLPKGTTLTALSRARAAWLWSAGDATLTRISAAAVLGATWLDPHRPAELCRANRHAPMGIVVHSYDLAAGESCIVNGMRVTTPARTVFDIGRRWPQYPAIPLLDALLNATNVKVAEVVSLTAGKPGVPGVRRLRAVLRLVDGGPESPPESRLRLLLVRSGLPAPETQIEFLDTFGAVRIRVDMGWRQWRVAVEYDGVQHWADRYQRSWDIERIAILEGLGWAVVRVSAELLSRPEVVVERVRGKLRAAGWPG